MCDKHEQIGYRLLTAVKNDREEEQPNNAAPPRNIVIEGDHRRIVDGHVAIIGGDAARFDVPGILVRTVS